MILEYSLTTNTPTIANITKTEARSTHGMVATKDIHSTEAGLEMLEQNGNAIDAAVAACFCLLYTSDAADE